MPSERCSEGNFYRFLLTLSQQLQDLHGVGGCARIAAISAEMAVAPMVPAIRGRNEVPPRAPSSLPTGTGVLAMLLTLGQQLQDLHGVGSSALAHLIAAAIPQKNYVFSGTPMQLDFARMNRSKLYAGLPAGWCCGYVTDP